MSELSLDDVLSGEESVSEPEAEVKTEAEEETTDTGETKEKAEAESEEKGEPPSPKPESAKEVPITALLDERERRQKAERELEELRGKQKPEQAVDPIEDPEGYAEQQNQLHQQQRFEDAFELMSELKPEVAEAWEWAQEETKENAVLLAKFSEHRGKPVALLKSVVKAYEQHQKVAQLEDVDAMEARIRAEVEAKVRAELESEQKGEQTKAAEVSRAVDKPSVVTTGNSEGVTSQGDMTLEDVIGADIRNRPR